LCRAEAEERALMGEAEEEEAIEQQVTNRMHQHHADTSSAKLAR